MFRLKTTFVGKYNFGTSPKVSFISIKCFECLEECKAAWNDEGPFPPKFGSLGMKYPDSGVTINFFLTKYQSPIHISALTVEVFSDFYCPSFVDNCSSEVVLLK